MSAEDLYSELRETPEEWRCREMPDIFAGLSCGRLREHEGDHAELAKGHPRAVIIWPQPTD